MAIQVLSKKKWNFLQLNTNLQTKIANSLRISPILSQLLINRGVPSVESAKSFLQSQLSSLRDPMLLPDIEKSSKRILEAIKKNEKITIFGDYDVDGISATALMVQCLNTLIDIYGDPKNEVDYYIPDRLQDGYGLNVEAIEMLGRNGTKVIITVDCGVNSFEEAKIAKEKGIDLIITDHHEPTEISEANSQNTSLKENENPDCNLKYPMDSFGLINPKLSTSLYPFRDLSGVGVAFMLAWVLGQSASNNKKVTKEYRNFLMDAMGLVALGTIADVVPLRQENRVLAKYGLSSLEHAEHPGIKALKEIVGLKDRKIDSYHVGFCLGPRINAAGRVGNARMGVEMLMAKSHKKAKEIAAYLDSENKKRQKIQSDILESARKTMLDQVDIDSEMAIVISNEKWHPGVIGIVASRLVGEFHRPVVVIATDNEKGQGSARSIPNFHLYNALAKCQDFFPGRKMLISFGGHAQAAGLRLFKKDISEFKKIFNDITQEQLNREDLIPTLNIDAEIKLSSISKSLLKELDRLSPHGEGNPTPVFVARGVKVVGQVRRFGVSGNHLSFYVRQGDVSFKSVAFGMGEKHEMLKNLNGTSCSIAFVLRDAFQTRVNNFQSFRNKNDDYRDNVELEIKDIYS